MAKQDLQDALESPGANCVDGTREPELCPKQEVLTDSTVAATILQTGTNLILENALDSPRRHAVWEAFWRTWNKDRDNRAV